MSDHHIKVQCQSCRNVWNQDLRQVNRSQRIVYRGGNTIRLRLRCLQCDKYVIISIDEGKLP